MKIQTEYYQHFDADFSLDVPAEGFGGWKTAEVEINPDKTAVVLMHAWDCGTPELYPGWFRACPSLPKTYEVCERVLPDLLSTVRASGMKLFHVVIDHHYYTDYPGYKKTLALAGDPPPAEPYCDSDPVAHRLMEFRNENVFVGKHNMADLARGWQKVKFPKQAEPVGDEGIAKDSRQLFALCRDAGINHLIYTGFNIDWCLLMSPAGMVDMGRRGLICSVIKEAVVAIENKETARNSIARELGLWRVSLAFGFVFGVEEFKRRLKAMAGNSSQR